MPTPAAAIETSITNADTVTPHEVTTILASFGAELEKGEDASKEVYRVEASVVTTNDLAVVTTGEGLEESKDAIIEGSKLTVGEATTKDDALLALGDKLEKVLSKLILKDDPIDKEVDRPTQLLKAYLFINEKEFVRVLELRDRGWNTNKEEGDAYFKEQREKADKADHVGEKSFYTMMRQIAYEMDLQTRALTPRVAHERAIKVLDICMAPGGYSAAVLKIHPSAQIFGITLDKEAGGQHPLLLPFHKLHECKLTDVTMLATDFTKGTDRIISKVHPDYPKFNTSRPFVSHKMDIVLCDGMVLRTHQRSFYRQYNEATRLDAAQLILGLQRIIQGGTLIMLLHKINSWSAVSTIHTFTKFAKVQIFKPIKKHSKRSSFYMIAKEVDVECPAAVTAIAEWKRQWYGATFGREDGTGIKTSGTDEKLVLQVIQEFGPTLIKMGIPVWKIQADALSKTSWAGEDAASLNTAVP